MAYGMGLRSFVALPVEKGGIVFRSIVVHNADIKINSLKLNAAYGLSATQTLLLGTPYRLSSGNADRLGDVSALYRHTVWQSDNASGTTRLGLLGGAVVPTDSKRDSAAQAGAVLTRFRDRYEIDVDALYQSGVDDRPDSGRYDLSWQYRIAPATYPDWGIGPEWYIVGELGGRWAKGENTTQQVTVGLQRVTRRWVLEGGMVRDLTSPNETQTVFSVRFH